MSEQKKAQELFLGKHEHGRPSTYKKGCRCADCRAGAARRQRAWKARAKERLLRGEVQIKHGRGGYTNWGCRCRICTDAHVKACKPATDRWIARNPEKKIEKVAIWNAKIQDATLEKATRHYYRWTSSELEIADRDDLSSRGVALLIGRSYAAVRNMRRKLKDGRR